MVVQKKTIEEKSISISEKFFSIKMKIVKQK